MGPRACHFHTGFTLTFGTLNNARAKKTPILGCEPAKSNGKNTKKSKIREVEFWSTFAPSRPIVIVPYKLLWWGQILPGAGREYPGNFAAIYLKIILCSGSTGTKRWELSYSASCVGPIRPVSKHIGVHVKDLSGCQVNGDPSITQTSTDPSHREIFLAVADRGW